MEHPTTLPPPTQPRQGKTSNPPPLKYTFDGHFSPATPPDDDDEDDDETTPKTREEPNDNRNSGTRQSSESRHSSPCLTAGIRVIANALLNMELAQLEMIRRRESDRMEAQLRRAQLEDEMTRMMLQTQSQIASFVQQKSSSRKRKKAQP